MELKYPLYTASVRYTNYQSYQSGIEMTIIALYLRFHDSINRTKVELKWSSPGVTTAASLLPINRTKVELKCTSSAIMARSMNYQSYQSGIEIFFKIILFILFCNTINRTKVELKSVSGLLNPVDCRSYQSYQSGIEMCIPASMPLILIAYQSYQSGIEIYKRGSKRADCGSSYQSYQSGIEMSIDI